MCIRDSTTSVTWHQDLEHDTKQQQTSSQHDTTTMWQWWETLSIREVSGHSDIINVFQRSCIHLYMPVYASIVEEVKLIVLDKVARWITAHWSKLIIRNNTTSVTLRVTAHFLLTGIYAAMNNVKHINAGMFCCGGCLQGSVTSATQHADACTSYSSMHISHRPESVMKYCATTSDQWIQIKVFWIMT